MRCVILILGLVVLASLHFSDPVAAAGGEGALEALGTRTGPFCQTLERARSKHVRVLCIGKVEMRWKFTTLLGEPVVNAIARWTEVVDSILLQTNTEFSTATASAKVQAAFARVGPVDMLIKTDVEVAPRKPCATFGLACLEKRAKETWNCWVVSVDERPACERRLYVEQIRPSSRKAYLLLDPGALGKKDKWSFNAPGSPSWGKLFDSSLIRCDTSSASAAAPGFVPSGVAKLVVKRGITLKNLGGCKIKFGGLDELNRALEETCEGYTGNGYERDRCLEKKKKKDLVKKKKSDEEDAFDKSIAEAEGGKANTPDVAMDAKLKTTGATDPFAAVIAEVDRNEQKMDGTELGGQMGGLVDGGKNDEAVQKRLIAWRDTNINKCDVTKPKPPKAPYIASSGLTFTRNYPIGHPKYCDAACRERGRRVREEKERRAQESQAQESFEYNAKLRQYNEVVLAAWKRQRQQCIRGAKENYDKRLQDLRDARALAKDLAAEADTLEQVLRAPKTERAAAAERENDGKTRPQKKEAEEKRLRTESSAEAERNAEADALEQALRTPSSKPQRDPGLEREDGDRLKQPEDREPARQNKSAQSARPGVGIAQ